MAAKPTPERIALAYARNIANDARRYPRQAITDLALLIFIGAMLLGLQSKVVTEIVGILGESAQVFVNTLCLVAGAFTLVISSTSPAHLRRTAKGNWQESLQIDERTHARWAIRQACYSALLVSTMGLLLLLDVALMDSAAVRVSIMSALLMLCIPVAVVLIRSAFQWKMLLCPPELVEREGGRRRRFPERHWALSRFNTLLTRGVARFILANTSSAAIWLKLIAALVATVTTIALAVSKQQAQLLLLGAVLTPLIVTSSLELPIGQVYQLSRSLPLSFRKLTAANAKITLLPPLLFGLPFAAAVPFMPNGGHWFLILLLTLPGMATLSFLRLSVEQAFPQSKVTRALFTFAAAVGIAVFSMQAPLIAPLIGVVLCVVWLLERGWGVWEFGYGERTR